MEKIDIQSKKTLYDELHAIIGFPPPRDRVMMLFTKNPYAIDIVELDRKLDMYDSFYDSTACTYKGKENISINLYVKEKFGNRAVEIIEQLLG